MDDYTAPDLPTSTLERVKLLEQLMGWIASGKISDDARYSVLRRELMTDPSVSDLLPSIVREHRSLPLFWPFIKRTAATYAERKQFIADAFTPLIDHLEFPQRFPGDASVSDALTAFNAAGVEEVWNKALTRRTTDPEGAITAARTLLETVLKHLLDDLGVTYTDREDLPKLYGMVATALNLAPSQHSEEAFRTILGGATTVVNGLGTLRNRLSDSHGKGTKARVKPSARHASLAVNMAGALASFIVETHLERK